MAHQIEILMLPDDVASLERDLEQLKFLVIPSELKEPQLVTEAGFQIRKFGEENLTVYLARQEDLPFVVVRPSGNVKVWTIDDLRSPVIQFHRCCQYTVQTGCRNIKRFAIEVIVDLCIMFSFTHIYTHSY